MAATMLSMDDPVLVDVFTASELMPDDLIEIDGEVCEVVTIDSTKDGYAIAYIDPYGEHEVIEVSDDTKFNFYVYIED